MNRRIPLLAGVVVVVILAVWFLGVWKPASSRLSRAQAAKAAALVKQDGLDGQLASLVRLQRDLPTTESSLDRSESALPTTLSLPSVITQVQLIAQSDGIAWSNESQTLSSAVTSATSPATDTSSAATGSADSTSTTPGNSTIALTMTVAGSYASMSRFITDLEQLPRLVVVDSLDYTPQGARGVEVKIGARAFYDNAPVPKLPAAVPAG